MAKKQCVANTTHIHIISENECANAPKNIAISAESTRPRVSKGRDMNRHNKPGITPNDSMPNG